MAKDHRPFGAWGLRLGVQLVSQKSSSVTKRVSPRVASPGHTQDTRTDSG